MAALVRPIAVADTDACGRICYDGYKQLGDRHRFRPAFASVEAATRRVRYAIGHPEIFGVAAELDDRVVGFNFVTEMDPVRAVGPLVVDPSAQGHGIGRRLMTAVLDRAGAARSIRLVTATYNFQSLPLYTALGFAVREPLLAMVGRPERVTSAAGYEIRRMSAADLAEANALHNQVHGYSRAAELHERCSAGTAIVALRGGKLCAYLASPKSIIENHGVAETSEAMTAVIAGAGTTDDGPLSLLLPVRQAALFDWCLKAGLQLVNTMVLMSRGDYDEPRGAHLPSILY